MSYSFNISWDRKMIWYKNSLLKTISSGWNIEDFMSMSFVFLTNHRNIRQLPNHEEFFLKNQNVKAKGLCCSFQVNLSLSDKQITDHKQQLPLHLWIVKWYKHIYSSVSPSNTPHFITLILPSVPLCSGPAEPGLQMLKTQIQYVVSGKRHLVWKLSLSWTNKKKKRKLSYRVIFCVFMSPELI